jgi:hypothetical protein
MTYELTQKALDLKSIIVQHLYSSDYLLDEYENREDAVKGERAHVEDDEGIWGDGDDSIVEYDLLDVQQAAEENFGWSITLGLVEEVEEE